MKAKKKKEKPNQATRIRPSRLPTSGAGGLSDPGPEHPGGPLGWWSPEAGRTSPRGAPSAMGGAAAPPGDQAGPLRLQVEMPVWALAQLQPCGAGTRTGRVCATPRGRQLHVSAFVPEVIARLGAVLVRGWGGVGGAVDTAALCQRARGCPVSRPAGRGLETGRSCPLGFLESRVLLQSKPKLSAAGVRLIQIKPVIDGRTLNAGRCQSVPKYYGRNAFGCLMKTLHHYCSNSFE